MKRLNVIAISCFLLMTMLVVVDQAQALQSLKAYKEFNINIIVTPSPIAYIAPPAEPGAVTPGGIAFAQAFRSSFGRGLQDTASSYAGPDAVIAQAMVQPTPVPVSLNPQPDPNGNYLKIIPHVASTSVPYGTTTLTCAFEVMTHYTTPHSLTDWGYGTNKTNGSGPFPVLNYPATSDLAWRVPDLAATIHNYANGGSPGETTWTGVANGTEQHCVDLIVTVPNAQPAGNYNATIQYNLYVQ